MCGNRLIERANNALHLTAIQLRSRTAGELGGADGKNYEGTV